MRNHVSLDAGFIRLVLGCLLAVFGLNARADVMAGDEPPCDPGQTLVPVSPAQTSYYYRWTTSGPYSQWSTNGGSAFANAEHACEVQGVALAEATHVCPSDSTCTDYRVTYSSGNNCRVLYTRTYNDGVTPPQPSAFASGGDGLVNSSALTSVCIDADECTNESAETWTVNTAVPETACNALTDCKLTRGAGMCMGSSCVYTVTHTTENCGVSDPPGTVSTGDERCVSDGGVELCKSGSDETGRNCGYVNGEFSCLGSVETDGCDVFGDGSRVCGDAAPTPPVPDNGTPGVKALPDKAISVVGPTSVATTINYYSGGTAAGSSRDPGSSGDNPYDGEDDGNGAGLGDGTCEEGQDCGDGSVSGGDVCDAAPVCEGDALECEIIEQSWRNRCPELLTDDETLSLLGESGGTDVDGDGTSEGLTEGLPGSSDEPGDVSEMFDSTGWLSSRSCPSVYSVNLGASFGGTVSYDFSDACWFFNAIGYIVLVLGAYVSARIVIGGF